MSSPCPIRSALGLAFVTLFVAAVPIATATHAQAQEGVSFAADVAGAPQDCAVGYIGLAIFEDPPMAPATTDGVVAVPLEMYGLTGDIEAAITVVVTDASAAEVPGTHSWDDSLNTVFWRPDTAFTTAGDYTLDLTIDPANLMADCGLPGVFTTQVGFTNDLPTPTLPTDIPDAAITIQEVPRSASMACCDDNPSVCWTDVWAYGVDIYVDGSVASDSPYITADVAATLDGASDKFDPPTGGNGGVQLTGSFEAPYPLPVCATVTVINRATGETAMGSEVCTDTVSPGGPLPEVTPRQCGSGAGDASMGGDVASGGGGSSDGCECNSVRATESEGPTPLGLLGATAALLGLVSLARRRR